MPGILADGFDLSADCPSLMLLGRWNLWAPRPLPWLYRRMCLNDEASTAAASAASPTP